MSKIDINRDRHLTVWKYSDHRVHDLKSACDWIAKIADIPNIEVDYISVSNLKNRSDEGDTSTQISGGASSSEIYDKAKEADPDIISLTGEYKGQLIVTGVDLRDKMISIVLKNSSAKLIDEIQDALGIVD